jgi:hypothetical protein
MTHLRPKSLAGFTRLATAACVALGALPALATAPEPHIGFIYPAGGQRGQTVEVTVSGQDFKDAQAIRVTGEGVTAALVKAVDDKTLNLKVTIAPNAPAGQRDLRVVTPGGASNRFRFIVGELPEVREAEPNSGVAEAQRLEATPVVVNGQLFGADKDTFRFVAKAGQTIVCDVHGRRLLPYIADAVPGWLQAALTLYDANGRTLAYVDDYWFKPDPVLIYHVEKDGDYLIEVRDALYRGRGDFVYRLRVGALPFITGVYPLGAARGTTAKVQLTGVNLPTNTLDAVVPKEGPAELLLRVSAAGVTSNALPFAAGDAPEVQETEPNNAPAKANRVSVPATVNGRIQAPGDVDYFVFDAKAKERLILEVWARRLDSPLDSILTVSDAKGKRLAQDDDTTDTAYPMITHHADSRVAITFPETGEYVVQLRDVQGRGGDAFAYRLSIAPPWPDAALRVSPDNPRLGPGETAVMKAEALRRGEFAGPVRLAVKNLPEGYVLRGATVPAGQDSVRFTLTAPADVKPGLLTPAFEGSFDINGQTVVRQATPAEEVMQAFAYMHAVPTDELLLSVVQAGPLKLALQPDAPQVVDVPMNGEAQVVIRAVRTTDKPAVIRLAAEDLPKGLTVKAATIAADKDEATITFRAAKPLRPGFEQNVIVTGTMKAGKEAVTIAAPAISIRIVDGK